MPNRPQYTLKALLVIITALSVPLAVIGRSMSLESVLLLFPVVGGNAGYLIDGRDGICPGLAGGIVAAIIIGLSLPTYQL